MARSKFLQKIVDETPQQVKDNVRKYASILIKNKDKKIPPCTNCKCTDLEDWLACQSNR